MSDYKPSMIEIYKWDQGIVLQDISLIAFDKDTRKIQAIGYDARDITDPGVEIDCPLKNGQIHDWHHAVKLFAYFLSRTWKTRLKRPKVAVCMAGNATDQERTAMKEAMESCGAKKIILTELPLEHFLHTTNKKACDLIISIRNDEY